MITKTYQAIKYQTYDMYVSMDGKLTLVSFKGGSLRPPINGMYQTSDPKMQAALANDTSLGISFKEVGSFDDEAKPEETVADIVTVAGITSVQAAREYLLSNAPGTSMNNLPNRTAVLASAEKNKIVFPDLK